MSDMKRKPAPKPAAPRNAVAAPRNTAPLLAKHGDNKRAIALKYDSERGAAPLITAVGKGRVADKIIEVAERSGVARVEDEFQANALSAFDAGARVPKFLYDLVAEVLLFIEEADILNQNLQDNGRELSNRRLTHINGGVQH